MAILTKEGRTQAWVARRLGVRPQWVNQLIKGRRKPTAETVRRLADALTLLPDEFGKVDARGTAPALDKLQQELDGIREIPGVSSCTLYFQDPLWRGEYRLAVQSGVTYREPLYGFLSRRRHGDFASEAFVSDTGLEGKPPMKDVPPARFTETDRLLLGSFNEREGIGAYARVVHGGAPGRPEAILFVNYAKRRSFTEGAKEWHRALLRRLLPDLSVAQRELSRDDKQWLAEGAQIVQPASSIPVKDVVAEDVGLYFNRVLASALQALHVPEGAGLGTVHLYDPESRMLHLAGQYGPVTFPAGKKDHSVETSASVPAWVAEHRRSLLLMNVAKSEFDSLHVPLHQSVGAELAVPIEIDGELLGVLDLQSTEAGRFKPHHVRSLWYAANRVAIVHQLQSHARMNGDLLKTLSQAVLGGSHVDAALHDLESLAAKYLRAARCRIWVYDAKKRKLAISASDREDRARHDRVREDGFSVHVLRTHCAMWLYDIQDARRFRVSYWYQNRWQEATPAPRATRRRAKTSPAGPDVHPPEVNTALLGEAVRCQLGIPILVQGQAIGVAWVKFTQPRDEPSPTLMTLAEGFMAAAGLLVKAVRDR